MSNEVACPRCGATVRRRSKQNGQDVNQLRCGKCGSQFEVSVYDDGKQDVEIVDQPVASSHKSSLNRASLSLIITFGIAFFVLSWVVPGLGIVLAIFCVAPLIRTLMVVNYRKKAGRSTSTASKIGLLLKSVIVNVIVFCTLAAAIIFSLVVALWFLCFEGSKLKLSDWEMISTTIGILILSLAVVSLLAWGCWIWIRASWWHDTRRD